MNYDQIHYRCQVAVGRWPVDTVKQLETVMAKSMKYETSVRDGTHPGLNKVSLFNVQGFVDARDQLDRMRHGLPRDWKGDEFFYQDQNPKYKTSAPDPNVVLDALEPRLHHQRACRAWFGNFLGRATGWQPCRPGDHDCAASSS